MQHTLLSRAQHDRQCAFCVEQDGTAQQCQREATHLLSGAFTPHTCDGRAYLCEYHLGIIAGLVASKER